MSDQAPTTPPPGDRPDRAEDPVPDPHRTEPVPPAQEGMRPGVDPAVRPEQDEPLGPAEELVSASGAEASEEAAEITDSDDPEGEALLTRMGVEEEGIEGGQILGLVAATVAAVGALAVILIYLFYVPYRTQVGVDAEGSVTNYEQQDLRTEALAKLDQYTRSDSTYGLPITQAMALVASEYGGAGRAAAIPDTRQDWNLLGISWGADGAVQEVRDTDPTMVPDRPADGREEVGVDEDVDTVELIENDGDLDADGAEAVPDDIE